MRIDAVVTSQSIELAAADPWADWMLRNYRRWHYSGEHVGPEEPTHCASVEHQYVPRGDWGDDDDEPTYADPATEPVDERAGELVDRLVLAMPSTHREVLRLQYVRWPDWLVRLAYREKRSGWSIEAADQFRARKSGMHVSAYLDYLSAARRRLIRDLHNNVMTPRAAEAGAPRSAAR